MREEKETRKPSDYWTVLPSSTDWALNVVDPEGRHGAYLKGDGSVHIWSYEHKKEDMSHPGPKRIVYGDKYIDEAAEYRIVDIDDEILRLLALRETAIRYFTQHGHYAAHEEWYEGKPLGTVTRGEHIPVKLDIPCPLCNKVSKDAQ